MDACLMRALAIAFSRCASIISLLFPTPIRTGGMSPSGRFCCGIRLLVAANSDSVALARFAVEASDDGGGSTIVPTVNPRHLAGTGESVDARRVMSELCGLIWYALIRLFRSRAAGILCFKSALGLDERGNQVQEEKYQRDHRGRR
jgi:hypothetical protein